MTWGTDTDADDAAAQLKAFVDAGGTLVDTADVYGDGMTESILGSILGSRIERSDVVLASKAGIVPHGERRRNSSRGHLLTALDNSLRRLNTDYLDLWQVHAWDPDTPTQELVSALEIAVRSGRARYVGVSNFNGWQLAATATLAQTGNIGVVSNQVEYSLVERAAEVDTIAAGQHCGVGAFAWSPLGRGVLTGKYRSGTPADSRGASARLRPFVNRHLDAANNGIIEAIATAADGLAATPPAVALAWVRDQPGITAPLVGARTVGQLMTALSSEELVLPDEIRSALCDVSGPR